MSFVHKNIQDYRMLPLSVLLSVLRASCYASQSSSSAVGCGAGSGGMTSDILANAPPVPAGASPDSPPAGPLPDMPAERTGHTNYCTQFQPPGSLFFIS